VASGRFVHAEQFAKSQRQTFALFVGYVGRQAVADRHAGQDHSGAGRQAAVYAPDQHQDAANVAARVRQVELRLKRPARALECEAIGFRFSIAGLDLGRPRRGVDAAVTQDPAKAGCDIEIGFAPGMDDNGKLAAGLAVEDRDQPLVGIKLNRAFGHNPFRAALPACTRLTACDIENHRVGQLTDAADRRPLRRLRRRKAGSEKGHQPAENNGRYGQYSHAGGRYGQYSHAGGSLGKSVAGIFYPS